MGFLKVEKWSEMLIKVGEGKPGALKGKLLGNRGGVNVDVGEYDSNEVGEKSR